MTTEVDAIVAAANNSHLAWNTPLSEQHATTLVHACAVPEGGRVVDLGCGWGELLLRLVASAPDSTGDGVDTAADALRRGAALAAERDLADRVHFHQRPASAWEDAGYDVTVCVGASHAWPDGTPGALRVLHTALRPGGRALLGDGFWARPPTPEALVGLGAAPEDLSTLAELVELAVECGFRPLHVTVADEREWDVFESSWCAGGERWALAHPVHPLRDAVLARVDEHRRGWLRGYRGVLGFAYLVLVKP